MAVFGGGRQSNMPPVCHFLARQGHLLQKVKRQNDRKSETNLPKVEDGKHSELFQTEAGQFEVHVLIIRS